MKRNLTKFSATLLASLVGFSFVIPAHADDLDDRLAKAKSQQAQNQSAMGAVQDQLAETDSELSAAFLALQQIEAELPVAQAALEVAQAEAEAAQREADSVNQKLLDAQSEKTNLDTELSVNETATEDARSGVAEMARQAAKGDLGLEGLGIIVGAKSTDEVISDYQMSATAMRTQAASLESLRQAAAVTKNNQARLEAIEAAIVTLKQEAEDRLVKANDAQQKAVEAKAQVENLLAQQQAKKADIEARKAEEEARQAQLAYEGSQLTAEIQQVIGLQEAERQRIAAEQAAKEQAARDAAAKAAAAANNKGSGSSGSGSSGSSGSTGGQPSTGGGGGSAPNTGSSGFSYPTAVPYITSSYGYRIHPVFGYLKLHAGTDFRAYCGTPLYAITSGTVQWAKSYGGLGNQVLVNHGTIGGSNVMSSYNHLSKFAVSAGQSVSKGDLLGYSGTTGTSTACHLHLEIYVNGATVDPMSYLR